MGTWGIGSFENDDAADFVYEIEGAPTVATLRRALDHATGQIAAGDYLEAPVCASAVAAAEFLAALKNRDPSALSPSGQDVFSQFEARPSEDDLNLARAVVERVMKDSELAELFAESGNLDDWLAAMEALRARLG